MPQRTFLSLLLPAAVACCLPAARSDAGLVRHDRPLERYREYAARPSLRSVGHVRVEPRIYTNGVRGQPTDATGVLIAPRWVLTCAHVVRAELPGRQEWEFGGKRYHVRRVVLHPDFDTEPDRDAKTMEERLRLLTGYKREVAANGWDLALVELDRPVAGVEPAERYRGDGEVGRTATLIGYGLRGDGLDGPESPSVNERLAGENVIDAAGGEVGELSLSDQVLMMDFDHPDEPETNWSGAADALDLEIGMVGGDSGGGVFLETPGEDGGPALAGIVFGGPPRSGRSDEPGMRTYGQIILAIRVSKWNDWIDGVLASPLPGEDESTESVFEVVDPAGRPLTGYRVHGALPFSTEGYVHADSRLSMPKIDPEKKWTFVVIHDERELGMVVRPTAEKLAELDGTVKLLPLATVTARLVDATGAPLANAAVTPLLFPKQRIDRRLPPVKTDPDGRLTLRVPCWSKYWLLHGPARDVIAKTVSVRPGETYDLGEVAVNDG